MFYETGRHLAWEDLSLRPLGIELKSLFLVSPEYREDCGICAREYGKANPGDPFSRDRAISHLRSGLAIPLDYRVEWRNEGREYIRDEKAVEYVVSVPTNMRHI